ncbi:hypothetical protein SARC_03168 [Sphaeroforma arctica JP610]|uniref:RING-type domain-containing protein n=1 Tax=Sphaeroforma arctica JP610 TaxID=667725 RepID=A0A0L0G8T3_9EUKA|nr:hypothetical protein SARC_03168 [Sphaeroforma arctica JP610]KNC84638.1 hypothetical protein SARC_03168 [Sphaeroforma arctica JP610]|eukprot:XP_014158540.1 hypothetical protein SARC_03168 [Sphaeroforma arctica JP610]
MGGEAFPSLKAFLFGPITDLAHLGNPTVVKEGMLESAENGSRTDAVQCGINLHRSSLRIARVKNPDAPSTSAGGADDSGNTNSTSEVGTASHDTMSPAISAKFNPDDKHTSDTALYEEDDAKLYQYWLRFRFDSVCRVRFIIHLGATEYTDGSKKLALKSRFTSEPFYYEAGFNQEFEETEFTVKPSHLPPSERKWLKEMPAQYPMVVMMEALNERDEAVESMTTTASFEENAEFKFSCSVMKQKICSGGVVFMLQEIYGLEEDDPDAPTADEDDAVNYVDDEDHECIVCLCDPRDTAVLPCRHLCLCHACAEVLRYQSNKCPMCRAPFHSLLCISVAKKLKPGQDPLEEEEEEEFEGERYRLVPISHAADKIEPPIKEIVEVSDGDESKIEIADPSDDTHVDVKRSSKKKAVNDDVESEMDQIMDASMEVSSDSHSADGTSQTESLK